MINTFRLPRGRNVMASAFALAAVLTTFTPACSQDVVAGPFNASFTPAGDEIAKVSTNALSSGAYTVTAWVKPVGTQPSESVMAVVGPAKAPVILISRIDGTLAATVNGTTVKSTAALPIGQWTHVGLTVSNADASLFANGQRVGEGKISPTPVTDATVVLAPRGTPQLFSGHISAFEVATGTLSVAALKAQARHVPDDALVAFEAGSPNWPVQIKQQSGLATPQPANTLPQSRAAVSEPVAKPAQGGPVLVRAPSDRWLVKGWKMQAAPLVTVADATVSKSNADTKTWYSATVPGTVLTTLVDRGVYPDPDYGLNNLAIPESLNKQSYWYRSEFELPANLQGRKHLFVNFKGINYLADVWINGHALGTIKGAFIRGQFDLAPYLNAKGPNVLAVKVAPPPHPGIPHEESIKAGPGDNGGIMAMDGPTFIASEGWDWIPSVRDRNTGLWQDVELRGTNDVRFGDAQVITALPKADNSEARLTIDLPLRNLSPASQHVTIEATIRPKGGEGAPIEIKVERDIAPGESLVTLNPDAFHQLIVEQPKLWWPNGYGDPNLYELDLKVSIKGVLSDQDIVRFGIRQVTYELSLVDEAGTLQRVEADYTKGREAGLRITDATHEALFKLPNEIWAMSLRPEAQGTLAAKPLKDARLSPHLVIRVNGRRIAVRGGNWGMDDFMKRVDRERMEPFFKLHHDANINTIRNWVGQSTEDVFYDLADEYGLMVLNDFWTSTQDFNMEPEDPQLFVANAKDVVDRYRNHPSIVLWEARNEGVPQPVLNEALQNLIYSDDGTRLYLPNSRKVNMQDSGPWAYAKPEEYFTELAQGFSTEVGTPSFPTLEAFKKFIPASEQWPMSDTWAYHDWHTKGGGAVQSFTDAMEATLGIATDLPDFERKAQLMNYESYRAIFEGMNAGLWTRNSGRLLWMTQPAWASTHWQILSHDYDTHGAFYGVQKALEPLHAQMNLPDHTLVVVNTGTADLIGGRLRFVVYGPDGQTVVSGERAVDLVKDCLTPAMDVGLADVLAKHPTAIVNLTLTDHAGAVLSRNTYWQGLKKSSDGRMADLPQVKLIAKTKRVSATRLSVELTNPSATPVLNAKLTLVDSRGDTVLPTYYSENYVAIMPHQTYVVTVDYPGKPAVTLRLRAWNVLETNQPVK